MTQKILHVDMDAFYASVEQRDRPELRGIPLAVGGSPQGRGVVAASSYEARRFGVRSAMAAAKALRLCPQLTFVRPDFARYSAVSQQVFAIFRSITEHVEPLSLDEAYLDVTENHLGEPSATRVAMHIRQRIKDEVQLTASAGVASVKFVAKIASDYNKPDGLTVVPPDRVLEFLEPLPIEKLWGVGPATATRIHAIGIRTIGELGKTPVGELCAALGIRQGRWLWRLAQGDDPRRVAARGQRKSCSAERTFPVDILDLPELEDTLAAQSERIAGTLDRSGLQGRTVTLKLRYDDFSTISRAETLPQPTRSTQLIHETAVRLLRRTEAGTRPVRLIGVGVSGFGDTERQSQLALPFP